jgi:membrane protease YdiL (CAAX protease family)
MGAAPWEELVFRVGVYGALFLVARRTSAFLGLESLGERFVAELAALLGSAFLFAWFHLESAQRLIGSAGEPYQHGLFLWRVSAGILLGGLFRWRGFGVASWAHAVFNLGIALGIRV